MARAAGAAAHALQPGGKAETAKLHQPKKEKAPERVERAEGAPVRSNKRRTPRARTATG